MKKILKLKIVILFALVIVAIVLLWWFSRSTEVHIVKEEHMENTPVLVEKIRSIGQWEFLSVSDEEIVDTIRHGFFGDDELSRIYYGTLRLGIDLSEVKDDWIKTKGDTTYVTLPHVKLLDDNFIDETRTKSFIEDGKWTEEDRAALTNKAIQMMRKRCLTKANYKKAEDNAKKEIGNLIRATGIADSSHLKVVF